MKHGGYRRLKTTQEASLPFGNPTSRTCYNERVRRWNAPMTPVLHLYNTRTRQLEAFTPMKAPVVTMYVCGPTVYDDPHLGHARCYITWDVLFRFLTFLGYDVQYARNITDVDDKILNKARAEGVSPSEIAQKYTQRFHEAMAALNVLPPTHEPRATEHITPMQEAIQALVEKGLAYPTPDGTVYFNIDGYNATHGTPYGSLSQKPLDDLQAGARVEVDPHKKSPLDFALWKGISADDPDGWTSPWGWGRPGWHLECSAMNRAIFGDQIDLHAGGADLIFPHHENEVAQSEAWTGCRPFVNYWLHNGFVNVSGEKMSKSLGNFSTIQGVLDRYKANAIRYFLLQRHYRSPVDFTEEALEGAQKRMQKIHRTLRDAIGTSAVSDIPMDSSGEAVQAFMAAMGDDLNTAKALSVLDGLIGEINKNPSDRVSLAQALTLFRQLGFDVESLYSDTPEVGLSKESVQPLIDQRKQARAAKDWTTADRISQELRAAGIQLMDRPDGTTDWEYVGTPS